MSTVSMEKLKLFFCAIVAVCVCLQYQYYTSLQNVQRDVSTGQSQDVTLAQQPSHTPVSNSDLQFESTVPQQQRSSNRDGPDTTLSINKQNDLVSTPAAAAASLYSTVVRFSSTPNITEHIDVLGTDNTGLSMTVVRSEPCRCYYLWHIQCIDEISGGMFHRMNELGFSSNASLKLGGKCHLKIVRVTLLERAATNNWEWLSPRHQRQFKFYQQASLIASVDLVVSNIMWDNSQFRSTTHPLHCIFRPTDKSHKTFTSLSSVSWIRKSRLEDQGFGSEHFLLGANGTFVFVPGACVLHTPTQQDFNLLGSRGMAGKYASKTHASILVIGTSRMRGMLSAGKIAFPSSNISSLEITSANRHHDQRIYVGHDVTVSFLWAANQQLDVERLSRRIREAPLMVDFQNQQHSSTRFVVMSLGVWETRFTKSSEFEFKSYFTKLIQSIVEATKGARVVILSEPAPHPWPGSLPESIDTADGDLHIEQHIGGCRMCSATVSVEVAEIVRDVLREVAQSVDAVFVDLHDMTQAYREMCTDGLHYKDHMYATMFQYLVNVLVGMRESLGA